MKENILIKSEPVDTKPIKRFYNGMGIFFGATLVICGLATDFAGVMILVGILSFAFFWLMGFALTRNKAELYIIYLINMQDALLEGRYFK